MIRASGNQGKMLKRNLGYTLLVTALCLSGCAAMGDDDAGPEPEVLQVEYGGTRMDAIADGEAHEIAGIGRIQYLSNVRVVANIVLPGGGAVHFHETESGHGCAGFLPVDAPEGSGSETGREGCLSAFIALSPPDTPVPAALLRGSDGGRDIGDREIVDAIEAPISAVHLPLAANVHPQHGWGENGNHSHSCGTGSGGWGTQEHWENIHCVLGGADHCDPGWLTGMITISSGQTYNGSYQDGLFCNADDDVVNFHYYYSGGDWSPIWGWNSVGINDSGFRAWSVYRGEVKWKRRITTNAGSGQYRHYTKMCSEPYANDCFPP